MQLDTTTSIYIGTDAINGTVHVLTPRGATLQVEHLQLDDRDPENTDAAEYRLLEKAMNETRIDL